MSTAQEDDFASELAFHRREWFVQRVGWAILAAFLLLALTGLFGGGPLSEARVGDPRAGTIEYERFARRGSRTTLTIRPAPAALQADRVRLAFSREYLRALRVETITPEPTRSRTSGDQLIYEFGSDHAGAIYFVLEPDTVGSQRAAIGIGDATPLLLRQLIYP